MNILGKDAATSDQQRSTHGEQLAKALDWIVTAYPGERTIVLQTAEQEVQ